MLWLLPLAVLVGNGAAFNLEPRLAIVKRGRPGSYFGYSVAQHQIVGRDRMESVALVGAPVDNSGQPGTNRTGLLWSCPLTQSSSDCKAVRGAVPGHDLPPRLDERRDDQWLGVSVDSQGPGKKVIVCAHRYQRRGPDYNWGQGLCYTLTQFLHHDETWEPCSGRETARAHEEWGYCQAGTSAMITDDDTALMGTPGPFTWRGTVFALSTSDDFLFRDKTHYHLPVMKQDSPVDKYSYLGMAVAAGNFLPASRSCGEYLSYAAGAPRANGTGQVILFVKCHSELLSVQMILSGDSFASSFGYSLASVDVNGDGYADLFVSAPFYYTKEFGGAVYYYTNSISGISSTRMPAILRAAGPESRFGFALSSAGDVNADGFQDLVVGAPYEGRGVVYLYQGGPSGLNLKPSQLVRSEDLPGMPLRTFGYSLSGGLDLDMNNHTDVLVGAYASDAAVILRARPVIDIITWFGNRTVRINPSLEGCDMDPTSKEICFELESCFQIRNFPINIDTTNIKYRIVAEVFKGGRKFSRVRLVVKSKEAPTHTKEQMVVVRKNSLDGCFKELVYLKEGTTDITTPIKFLVEYSLEQDEPSVQGSIIPNINQFPILNMNEASKELEIPFHKDCGEDDECQSQLSTAIVVLSHSDDETATATSGRLELGEGREVVVNVTLSNSGDPAYFAWVTLNFSTIFSYVGRSDNLKDILCDLQSDISIRCNLGNPFLRKEASLQFKFVPLYSPQMPSDVMFTANTTTTSINLAQEMTVSRQLTVVRRAEVSLRGSMRPEYILYGGEVVGESAVRTIPEIGSRVIHTFHIVNDGPWQADSINFHIDWPFQVENGLAQGKWLLYLTDPVEISPPGIGQCFLSPRHVNFLGLRKRTEAVAAEDLGLRRRAEADGGRPPLSKPNLSAGPNSFVGRGNKDDIFSSSESDDNFFSSSSYSFSSSSSSSSSRTSWLERTVIESSRSSEQKEEEGVYSARVRRAAAPAHVSDSARVRRATEHVVEPDHVLDSEGRVARVVVFDCGRETAKCLTISCSIAALPRGSHAIVRLRSRVWNSTLVEDYPRVDSVIINSRARLELPPHLAAQQMHHDDEIVVGVVAYPDGLGETGLSGVPVWIMVTAIVAGLLLVTIITLILWKFGFFERKRVSDVTQSVKVGKHSSPLLRGDEYIS